MMVIVVHVMHACGVIDAGYKYSRQPSQPGLGTPRFGSKVRKPRVVLGVFAPDQDIRRGRSSALLVPRIVDSGIRPCHFLYPLISLD
jgi:hypothetical protein